MFSAIQILLIVVVVVLTALAVVIGIQAWGLIKQLRELVADIKESGQAEKLLTWWEKRQSSGNSSTGQPDSKDQSSSSVSSWRSSTRSFYRRGRNLS